MLHEVVAWVLKVDLRLISARNPTSRVGRAFPPPFLLTEDFNPIQTASNTSFKRFSCSSIKLYLKERKLTV